MTYEDYLIHSSELYHAVYGPQPRNRMTKKKPKYVAKEGNRYFYTQAEYDAFKRGGRRSSSRSSYDRSVQRQQKNAQTYGPIRKTVAQKTSLKKEVQKAVQKSRPAMVRLRDKFNKTLSDIKKTAKSVIDGGRSLARDLLTDARESVGDLRRNFSESIQKGKDYISRVYKKARPIIDRKNYVEDLSREIENRFERDAKARDHVQKAEEKLEAARKSGFDLDPYKYAVDMAKASRTTNTEYFLKEAMDEYKKLTGNDYEDTQVHKAREKLRRKKDALGKINRRIASDSSFKGSYSASKAYNHANDEYQAALKEYNDAVEKQEFFKSPFKR